MSCLQTELQVLQAILDQDSATFDRLAQINQTVSTGSTNEYAYFYNLAVSATVAIGGVFPFDSTGVTTAGIVHTNSATPATSAPITLLNAGTYEFIFTTTVAEAHQVALFVNGVVNLTSIYGQATGTATSTGIAIITVPAGAVITLRNHLSAAALTLVQPSGGTATNNTNSITIKKLA